MKHFWFILLGFLSVNVSSRSSKKQVGTRLYGSRDAKDGQYPYTTLHLQSSGYSISSCTGSVVSETWAMTAAHCINPRTPPRNHLVAAGKADMGDYVRARRRLSTFSQDIDESNYGIQERRATALYRHPQYNRFHDHDVGLVKLNKPWVYNNRVRPIPVASKPFEKHSGCTLTGYGLTENNARRYHLQYINGMPARASQHCRYMRNSDVICLSQTNRGLCHGDSGGPLACDEEASGVASRGLMLSNTCGRGVVEQYYTDTYRNRQWINSTISKSNSRSRSSSKNRSNSKKRKN